MLRSSHCPDNQLTDGGEVVSLTRRLCSTLHKYFLVLIFVGARGSVVIKALCYKPEGSEFDIR
jgi:hypothetical protein